MSDIEYDINGKKTNIYKKSQHNTKTFFCYDCKKIVIKGHSCKPFKSADPEVMKICESGAIAVRCGACGHYDDMVNFSKTEINGELPYDIFQCPKCQTAIKRYYDNGVKHKKIVTIM